MESAVEKKTNELLRRGDVEKAKVLQNLCRIIMPTQVQRIRRNDRTVLQEMVLPRWLSWELLREWAEGEAEQETGKLCALCSGVRETGVKFKEKFVCESCFKELKGIPQSQAP